MEATGLQRTPAELAACARPREPGQRAERLRWADTRRTAPAPVPPALPPHAAAPARWALARLRAPARLQAGLAARGGCWPRADTRTLRHTDAWPHGSKRSRTRSEGARSPPPRSGGRYRTNPAVSCSFYLFVLPSTSSRALSSLAWASYSSSTNSCCRFHPERKESHSQSFAARGRDRSASVPARVPREGRGSSARRTPSCVLCRALPRPTAPGLRWLQTRTRLPCAAAGAPRCRRNEAAPRGESERPATTAETCAQQTSLFDFTTFCKCSTIRRSSNPTLRKRT